MINPSAAPATYPPAYGGGKLQFTTNPGLILNEAGYSPWPERDWAGNAIDFFMHALGLSFHDGMRQIIGP